MAATSDDRFAPLSAWPEQTESPSIAFPTQSPAWIGACAQALAHTRKIAYFSSPTGAAAPSVTASVALGGRLGWRWELLGLPEFYEPADWMWSDPEEIAHVAEQLLRNGRALHFNRIAADSPVVHAIRQVFAGRGVVLTRAATPTPVIELHEGWADPLSQFNAGRRSDFRRAMRHAEKHGAVSYEIHAPTEENQLNTLLEEAFAVEANSWKGETGSALAVNDLSGGFYRDFARRAMNAGTLRLAFMRLDGRAVGMQIALEWQQRFWLQKIGYDQRFGKASPGQLLMLHTAGDCARRGLRSYEFLGDPAPWTEVWTKALRPCARVLAYPRSLRGLGALGLDFAEVAVRKLQQRVARTEPPPPATPAETPQAAPPP